MKLAVVHHNEYLTEEAFTKQAVIFDELYAGNTIVQYKRNRVRQHIMPNLTPGSNILELNSGTGEDAIFFAGKGFQVHATDISTGMQEVLKEKVKAQGLDHLVTTEVCSFTQLAELKAQGPYDFIFSNFAGLNCTGELDKVLQSLSPLVKPGGMVTMVILPKFCLWEAVLVFKGKFKTATRRFFSENGAHAHLEGTHFKCWYYNPSYVKAAMKADFQVMEVEGLCAVVPPSYLEGFAEKYPKTYNLLKRIENKYKAWWPLRCIGDYYIISMNKVR